MTTRGHVAAHQAVQPRLRVGAEHGGEEDRGHGQKGRDQHPDHRLALVDHLQQRGRVADVEQDEQQKERRERRAQRQPGERKDHDRDEPDDLVGARLDEHEGAGERHQPQQRAAQRSVGEPRPRGRDGIRLRQAVISTRSRSWRARTACAPGCRGRTAPTSSRCSRGRARRAAGSSPRCRSRRASR